MTRTQRPLGVAACRPTLTTCELLGLVAILRSALERQQSTAEPARGVGIGAILRDPPSAQLSLHPAMPGQVDEQLALLPEFEQLGCEHMVLAFRQPPTARLLERCAALREAL